MGRKLPALEKASWSKDSISEGKNEWQPLVN